LLNYVKENYIKTDIMFVHII